MFGKDDELEKVKSALAAMDGDMSAFRVWQKQYDKLNRQWQAVQERYQKARQITEQVHRNAKQLEEILVDDTQGQRKEAAQILKEWNFIRHMTQSCVWESKRWIRKTRNSFCRAKWKI